MRKKQLTNKELNRISQKYHCYPETLTDEEKDLLPIVREWENDYYAEVTIIEDKEDSFENMFLSLYKVMTGLEPLKY